MKPMLFIVFSQQRVYVHISRDKNNLFYCLSLIFCVNVSKVLVFSVVCKRISELQDMHDNQ